MYLERLEPSLRQVRRRIAEACERSGRADPEAVTVVAITKGHPLAALEAARDVGLNVIGESRVQEAEEKRELASDLGLEWHLVGHLQRNKVKSALPMFELIHSVDSQRLAREIEKEAAKRGSQASVLVQVNASGEESKYGFDIEGAHDDVREICALEHVSVLGLMTMAPYTDDEAVLRRTFRRTRELFDRCSNGLAGFEARHLSMGMTNDYEIAVEEGATMVRLGTALFGER